MLKANTIHNKTVIMLRPLILCLLVLGSWAYALPEDSQQPIYITSDSAIKDEKRGLTIYEGDVDMQQGTLKIKGDKITIYLENEQVTRIVAKGKPASFKQQPDIDKGDVVAKAITIEYSVNEKIIDLTDQATLDQDGTTMAGNKIHFDINASRVEAGGRVNVVIPPQPGP
jgi:lipopolysaccharide export system protein LptA